MEMRSQKSTKIASYPIISIIHGETVMSDTDTKDELIQAMQEELDRAVTKELYYDSIHAVPDSKQESNANVDHERIKSTVMAVLVASVQTQRLYFVIRSVIMGLISALITFIVVWFLGTVQVAQVILLGLFVFIIALIVSRLFDKQIVKASKKIITLLDKHKRLRTFILKKL
jgi:ABC-type multidrug transport system fused ATPase/permease subunit